MLNTEQTEALEVFVAYFTRDSPYEDMRRVDYLMLHEYFQRLPTQVFTTPRIKHLWHISKYSVDVDILHTESGIVSCTSSVGVKTIIKNLDVRKNDCKFKIEPPARVVSASKLLKVAQANGIEVYEDIVARVKHEREYVVLLEGLNYRLAGRFCPDKERFDKFCL